MWPAEPRVYREPHRRQKHRRWTRRGLHPASQAREPHRRARENGYAPGGNRVRLWSPLFPAADSRAIPTSINTTSPTTFAKVQRVRQPVAGEPSIHGQLSAALRIAGVLLDEIAPRSPPLSRLREFNDGESLSATFPPAQAVTPGLNHCPVRGFLFWRKLAWKQKPISWHSAKKIGARSTVRPRRSASC